VLVGRVRPHSNRVSARSALYASGIAVAVLLFGSRGLQNAVAEGDTRTISMHHVHTDEDITITFKRDGRYDEAALEKLNWFLRDWRRSQETRMDPHLIDLVWEVQREAGSKSPIWVVCGYRSPETNAMLRRRSGGVAKFSQHMLGHAMDFYIPGVPLEELRVIGLRLQRGGVGFYPTSGSPFVHMDTGNIRHWPRMTREQLVRVFPDGRTVHIPTDGRPLSGYSLALADIRKRGGMPSEMSIEAARSAGVDIAAAGPLDPSADGGRNSGNLFARLLGLQPKDEDEEADAAASAAAPTTVAAANVVPEGLRTRAKAAVATALDHAADKLAAEKAKLAQVTAAEREKLARVADKIAVGKIRVIDRAEAASTAPEGAKPADVAALTPNEVIRARGYWQATSDNTTAAAAIAAVARSRAAAEADKTGSIRDADVPTVDGPFVTASRDDRVAPELALAYAEQPERGAPLAVTPIADIPVTGARAATEPSGEYDTAFATKRDSARPTGVIRNVATRAATSDRVGTPGNDPWLRAIVVSPSVHRFLTVTTLGVRDFRPLAALMRKPYSSVMMTFGATAQPGLSDDRFGGGSAVGFVSTVTYLQQNASLL
jgi:uncharacterized protein YcbK (DUF882 family)